MIGQLECFTGESCGITLSHSRDTSLAIFQLHCVSWHPLVNIHVKRSFQTTDVYSFPLCSRVEPSRLIFGLNACGTTRWDTAHFLFFFDSVMASLRVDTRPGCRVGFWFWCFAKNCTRKKTVFWHVLTPNSNHSRFNVWAWEWRVIFSLEPKRQNPLQFWRYFAGLQMENRPVIDCDCYVWTVVIARWTQGIFIRSYNGRLDGWAMQFYFMCLRHVNPNVMLLVSWNMSVLAGGLCAEQQFTAILFEGCLKVKLPTYGKIQPVSPTSQQTASKEKIREEEEDQRRPEAEERRFQREKC